MRRSLAPVLLSLCTLACTDGTAEQREDAERVEPPGFEARRGPPDIAEAPHPDQREMLPGQVSELSYSTTGCYGSCPTQELILRLDGSFMYLGGSYSHHEGLYFDRMPQTAAHIFSLARAHPFGAELVSYRQDVTDHSTRYFSALDEHGRHYLLAYGSNERSGVPPALAKVEQHLRELIESIPADSPPEPLSEDELDLEPWPACVRYARHVIERCEPLLELGRANASCLYHAPLADSIDELRASFGADYVEPACTFMLESIIADAGLKDFIEPGAQRGLGPERVRACRAWAKLLFAWRDSSTFDEQRPNSWACMGPFKLGEAFLEEILE